MKTIGTNNNITVFVDTIECIDTDIETEYREEPVEWFRLGKWTVFNPLKTQEVLDGYEISFKTISGRWYYAKYETKEAAEIILKALIESRKDSNTSFTKEKKESSDDLPACLFTGTPHYSLCNREGGSEKECHAYSNRFCMNITTCKE